jgi:hypothetical protein
MTTVLKVLGANGNTKQVRVNEDPDEISAALAVAVKEQHPFVVFTNAETGKAESFKPGLVESFAAE